MDPNIFEQVRVLRLEQRQSLRPIAVALGISIGSASNYVRSVEDAADPELVAEIRAATASRRGVPSTKDRKDGLSYQKLRQRNQELVAEVKSFQEKLRSPIVSGIADVPVFKKGLIAEAFVTYRLMRVGLDVLKPAFTTEALDLVVRSSTRTYQCEVKSTCTDKSVSVVKTRYRQGKMAVVPYTESDRVDFFLLVNLIREDLFVVPASEVIGRTGFHMTPNSSVWSYKDRFDLFI